MSLQPQQRVSSPPERKRTNPFQDRHFMWLAGSTVAVFIILSVFGGNLFLSRANFMSMAAQFPQYGILALGITLVMVGGGIDLSMVGIANLAGILAAMFLTRVSLGVAGPMNVFLMSLVAILIALATGVLAGTLNGLITAYFGVPPILTTLGTQQLFTGIAIVLTGGAAIFGIPQGFTGALSGSLLGIPVPVLIFTVVAVVLSLLLRRTPFGTMLAMKGTNVVAARFARLNVNRIELQTYATAGAIAAISGLLIVAQTNSAKADYGASFTLQTILIAVLGGVNPSGGFGRVGGVVLAIFLLQMLSSGFNILGFSAFLKDAIWGITLLVVMVINYYSNERQKRPTTATSS